MNNTEFSRLMEDTIKELRDLKDKGQKEYARNDTNVFSNFVRVSQALNIDQKQVLLVFLLKHIDGIISYINGYKSQRENVRGRINDALVYLFFLRGMIEEEEAVDKNT